MDKEVHISHHICMSSLQLGFNYHYSKITFYFFLLLQLLSIELIIHFLLYFILKDVMISVTEEADLSFTTCLLLLLHHFELKREAWISFCCVHWRW